MNGFRCSNCRARFGQHTYRCPRCGWTHTMRPCLAPMAPRPIASPRVEAGAGEVPATFDSAEGEIVAHAVVDRKPGLLYFVDRQGNVRSTPMRRRRKDGR